MDFVRWGVDWGVGCDEERHLGRAGYCNMRVAHVRAARDFGREPLAGLVAARNLSVIDDPGVLFDRAECVVDGWLARSHGAGVRGRIAITF